MTPQEHVDHLFVVRIWHEQSQALPAGQWRGSVEHVPSGQRLYFVSLADMNDFMMLRTQAAGAATNNTDQALSYAETRYQ